MKIENKRLKPFEPSLIRHSLMLLGFGLTVMGGAVAAYSVLLIWRALHDPESITFFQFIIDQMKLLEEIKIDKQEITGYFEEKPFTIKIPHAVLYTSFFLANAIIISIIVNVSISVISSGVSLLKLSANQLDAPQKGNESKQTISDDSVF